MDRLIDGGMDKRTEGQIGKQKDQWIDRKIARQIKQIS